MFNKNIVYPHSIAPYVKVHSRANGILETSASNGHERYIRAFFTDSPLRAVRLTPYGGGADTLQIEDYLIDSLNTATLEGIGPIGLAVAIRNVSKADEVSGSVRVLVTPCPMTWSLSDDSPDRTSTTFTSNLRGMMSANPNVKTYTAAHFRESKSFSSFPANQVKSMD